MIRRVPVALWLAILVALAIGLNILRRGGRTRVEVVGTGRLGQLRPDDAPPGTRLSLDVSARASFAATRIRIEKRIGRRPDILVFGLPIDSDAPANADETLSRLMTAAEGAALSTVVAGEFVDDARRARWRAGPCRDRRRLICVDISGATPDVVRAAVARGILDAKRRLEAYRATTQRGR